MSCPVTYGAFKVVDEHTFGSNRRQLFQDMREEWDKVFTRIKEEEPLPTTQRLRGFFCIEVIYHLIIPSLSLPPGLVVFRSKFVSSRFPRDHGGLGQVIELCQEFHRGLVLEQGEADLGGKAVGAFQLLSTRSDTQRLVVAACEEAARTLRPMLRGPTRHIRQVGFHFGTALIAANVPFEMVTRYLHTMLDVSIHNPVTPWTMNPSRQVSHFT